MVSTGNGLNEGRVTYTEYVKESVEYSPNHLSKSFYYGKKIRHFDRMIQADDIFLALFIQNPFTEKYIIIYRKICLSETEPIFTARIVCSRLICNTLKC